METSGFIFKNAARILSVAAMAMLLLGMFAMPAGAMTRNQMIWIYIGVVGAMCAYLAGYRNMVWISPLFMISSAVLLVLASLDAPVDGVCRWVRWQGFGIQPSEFAKLSLVLFIASLAGTQEPRTPAWRDLLVAVGAAAVICGLLVALGDRGSALLLAAVSAFMLAATAGVRTSYLLSGFTVAAVSLGCIRCFTAGTFTAGIIMLSMACLGYVAIALSTFCISARTEDPQGRVLGFGIGAMIVTQAVLSLAGLGIPAPFVDYGSGNLMMSIICIGLLLNIAMSGQNETVDDVLSDSETL